VAKKKYYSLNKFNPITEGVKLINLVIYILFQQATTSILPTTVMQS